MENRRSKIIYDITKRYPIKKDWEALYYNDGGCDVSFTRIFIGGELILK